MKAPVRLWADVPAEERIDEAFLRTRNGVNTPGWFDRQLERLKRDTGCVRATLWVGETTKWHRCRVPIAPGESFCYRHGGPKPPAREKVTRPFVPQSMIDRLQIRREKLQRRRDGIDRAIAAIDAAIAALQMRL